MKSIITLSILFACLSSFGQQYFYKKFSGTTGVGWPVNAVTDNDGNFYISLMSGLPIKDRIAKIDAAGNMLWTKQYTVESNNAYGWEEVVPAHDGGFVFIGNDLEITNPSDQAFSKKRVHFVKIANSGNVVWTKRYNMNDSVLYNGNASYWSQAYSLIKIPTGGYLASADLYHQYSGLPGSGSSNILLMRLDNDGNLLWSKTFNINENSLYKALRRPVVQLCSNGDFIVSGNSENSGNSGGNVVGEAFIARFNSNGNPLWLKRYLFPFTAYGDYCIETSDGNFLTVGYVLEGGQTVPMMMKIDAQGNLLWNKKMNAYTGRFYRAVVSNDGNIIVSGQTSAFGNDVYMAKISNNGTILWQKSFGTAGSEMGGTLAKTDNGYLLLTSYGPLGTYNLGVIYTDFNGNIGESSCGNEIKTINATYSTMNITASNWTLWERTYTKPVPATSAASNVTVNLESVVCDYVALADFTFDEVCVGNPTHFNDTVFVQNAVLTSWSWNFGDGNTSTVANPVHQYANAGAYTVTLIVNSNVGITDTSVHVVNVYSSPSVDLGDNLELCSGNSAVLYPGVYSSYVWNNLTTNDSMIVTQSGTYSVTVTNAQACTGADTVNVTVHPPLVVNLGPDFSTCIPQDTVLNAFGSNVTSYLWNTGATTSSIVPLTYGTYSVTITNAAGCTATDQITLTPLPGFNLSFVAGNITCYNGNDGWIDLTVNGGVAPYTYSWSNGASTEDINFLPGGTYIVTVTDYNNCSTIDSVTIINPQPISLSFTVTNPLCAGTATGAALVSASGGVLPYTFSTSNGQNTNNLINLLAGTYSITVYDANSCSSDTSFSLSEPAPLNIITNPTNISCFGLNDGSIDVFVSGGTGSRTFVWSNGATTEDLTQLYAGNYQITVFDSNNCQASSSVILTEPAPIVINYLVSNETCNSQNGSILANVVGGLAPFNYAWNAGSTTPFLGNLSAGNYLLTVTDAMGCENITSVQIDNIPGPVISLAATDENCGKCNGSITTNITGGALPFVLSCSNGFTSNDTIITNLCAGNYTVSITDNNNCQATASATIGTIPGQSIQTVSQNTMCYNGSDGSANVNINGGQTPYSIIWSNNETTTQINNLTSGIYFVTVSDANGCIASSYAEVSQPEKLMVHIPLIYNACFGADVTLNASVEGGTAPYSYFWNGVAGTSNYSTSATDTSYISVSAMDIHGCKSDTTITMLLVGQPIQMSLYATNDSICPGTEIKIFANITGGIGEPYVYSHNGNAISLPFSVTPNEYSNSYIITATDMCGTTSTDTLQIYLYPLPEPFFTASALHGCAPLTITFNVSDYEPGTSFHWNLGEEDAISANSNPTYIYETPGSYNVSLTLTNQYGCSVNKYVNNLIRVYGSPDANFSTNTSYVSNLNPSVEFTNTSYGATMYLWSFGDGDSSLTENPSHTFPEAGFYTTTLVAINNYGCKDTTQLTLQVYEEVAVYAPTAFTPGNGDGINEKFNLFGKGIDENSFSLMIYDRWGELIFSTNNFYNGWDGTVKNSSESKCDTYTWFARFKDVQGKYYEKSGPVTLIR